MIIGVDYHPSFQQISVSGGTLTLMMNGEENIVIKDEKGDIANLTISNVIIERESKKKGHPFRMPL